MAHGFSVLGKWTKSSQGGVREGTASSLPVSYRRRGGESSGGGGGQRPQGSGSHATHTAQRPAEYASCEGGGPHQKAAHRTRRRVVRLTASVRAASPQQNRTEDPVARQPWVTPAPGAACDHGAGVRGIRSTLSDPDRPRQTGEVATACPAVHRPQ